MGVEQKLAARYRNVRDFSLQLSEVLSAEDCAIQSMPDVSPTRWHLAHTTWFFETFVLKTRRGYQSFRPEYEYLYNSYYNTVGEQYPRARRGLLSRPGLDEIIEYRRHVDAAMVEMLEAGEAEEADVAGVVEVGLNHEQQHQELLLTDIKHVLSCNPLSPVYREGERGAGHSRGGKAGWRGFEEGLYWVGHEGAGFAFDNEGPRHRAFLEGFEIRDRPVTCGEYLEFMKDGGYERPEFWLSMGWQAVREQGWRAPLYWRERESGGWRLFTMGGLLEIDLEEPVCHVSFFEADAYARWAGARLPTEAEWETAAASQGEAGRGNYADVLLEAGALIHPSRGAMVEGTEAGFFGDGWEWAASPYVGYPGYQALAGALGEYNGKFMCNQYVLRGGSCATSSDHMRKTYRNFFPPDARWQFSGIRLARGV